MEVLYGNAQFKCKKRDGKMLVDSREGGTQAGDPAMSDDKKGGSNADNAHAL